MAAGLAIVGPGLLAGLSDDDPAGITTYSVLGAEHGYRLLWIIPAAALVGIPPWASAPVAGLLIALVVVLGSFHRVEGVLLVISSTLSLYIVDGILARPDWSLVAWHTALPTLPDTHGGWLAVSAALGTTLAPWGLAFIQSYAVDKKIRMADMRIERIDVVVGSILTGVIGLAIAVACAATLHPAGIAVTDAAVSVVAIPGLPLIPLMYSSQVVNAVVLPLHVIALQLLAQDAGVMRGHTAGRIAQAFGWLSVVLIVACVMALGSSWLAQ